jgi:hypothetical protein
MGLYFRRSVRAGPFRFNFSTSGIGVSAGIPGWRVGTGPRGAYEQCAADSGPRPAIRVGGRTHGDAGEAG